eukprot:g138.t1
MRSDEIKKSEPPWVNKLLNFAENLALQPDTLDDSKCPPEWLPDRRVGIDSKLKSCVRVLDDVLETVPCWAIEEMKYFENQELPPTQPPSTVKKNIQIATNSNKKKEVSATANKRPLISTMPNMNTDVKRRRLPNDRNSDNNNNNNMASTQSSPAPQIRQQLNNPTTVPSTIPSTGDIYLKSQWKQQWNLRSMALHFPSAKVKRKGEQILYFCQSCPRIHDNLALRLAIWMARKLTLPLQVLCFLPKDIVNAREQKKERRKTWRTSTFRRKAFSEFAVSLQIYKIPLVGLTIDNKDEYNQNTGYVYGKMLSEWANIAKTHFIITDDTHCTYHNDQFKKFIVRNKEHFPCPIFQMDNDSMYPPRLMKQIQRNAQQQANGQRIMTFAEHKNILSKHRNKNYADLFNKDFCPDRLNKQEVVDFKVQLPLYLVGGGNMNGDNTSFSSSPPYVPDEIACKYDIIHWVSTLDRLNRANDSPLWDGSEKAGLNRVQKLIQTTMMVGGSSNGQHSNSNIRKNSGAFSMEFHDISLVESILSYIRIGSLSTRIILRSFCNGNCIDDAISGASRLNVKQNAPLYRNNQVLPFRNPNFFKLDQLIIFIREYRLYRVRMAYYASVAPSNNNGADYSKNSTNDAVNCGVGSNYGVLSSSPPSPLTLLEQDSFSINQYIWKMLIPKWVQENLHTHVKDAPKSVNGECFPGQLEKRATIDRFWNGIQWRLKYKGVIHPEYSLYWAYKIFSLRHSTPMASYDLMIQFLRSYLLGSHMNDEIFAICAEIFHMNLPYLNVRSENILRRFKLVDSYRNGYVKERVSIEKIKQIFSKKAFEQIIANGVRKQKK